MFNLFGKKKLEKKIENSVQEYKNLWNTDFNDIWSIDDRNSFLIALNGWLCLKCSYGENIEKLSAAEKAFYLNAVLESEVNNGGFFQFFYNSSGNYTNETIDSLRAVGAEQTEKIYCKALSALGSSLPKDQEKREKLLDNVTDSVEKLINECDSEFYTASDNLEELNYNYIIKNKELFSR